MKARFRLHGLAILAAILLPAPVSAQPAPLAPPAPAAPAAPPFDEGLLRLSEILGGLHYLRQLCGSGEGSLWRDQMQALLEAEEPAADRRAQFVDRFNRGYDSFKTVYLTCTPAATVTIDRYMSEGNRIVRDIAARYGKEE